MILSLVDDAVGSGARLRSACHELGLSVKTIQRWRKPGGGEDGRHGPRTVPANKLSIEERQAILDTVNSPQWRDLSPNQIVPRLADQDIYLASESTMYRILREEKQLAHRERSKPATSRRPNEHEATGPHQVWSWDITYLRGPVRGSFYYLYMLEDVWSRKIVGWQIHENESTELAAFLFTRNLCLLEARPRRPRASFGQSWSHERLHHAGHAPETRRGCLLQQAPRQRRQSLLEALFPNSQVPAGIPFRGFLLARARTGVDLVLRHLVQHRASPQCHTLRHSRRAP